MIDIHTITTDIAERLSLITGEPWNARLPAHGRDDIRIIVAERDQAEVEITHATSTHRHRRHATPPLRISVAGHRPAVEIAKEITRWLLTSYRAELHEARRRKATYDAARAYEEATAAELSESLCQPRLRRHLRAHQQCERRSSPPNPCDLEGGNARSTRVGRLDVAAL